MIDLFVQLANVLMTELQSKDARIDTLCADVHELQMRVAHLEDEVSKLQVSEDAAEALK